MSLELMLNVKELCVDVVTENGKKRILNGVNMAIRPGEIHAIMGLNGSGKSTLANVLAGCEAFEVSDGEVEFCNKPLLDMSTENRAGEGLFLAFQHPVELPGVNGSYFLRTSVNAVRKYRQQAEISVRDFAQVLRSKAESLDLSMSMINRSVNTGFSGGEKKRNEILQLMLLEPKLVILDEIDSGLDIDALQVVAKAINSMRASDRSFLIITHYSRLLDHIEPDFVHVMLNGRIVKTGGKDLALELEKSGYSQQL